MARITRAEAYAPASMGNVGVGFDILGLAFHEPGDVVIAEWDEKPGASIAAIEGDGGKLPLEAASNTASVAVNALLKSLGSDAGIRLTIKKGLPLGSGLGSSAASAVAAVVAANALLDEPLHGEELLPACLEGEALVSGYHADNVGPCLLGGITLINSDDPTRIQTHLPVPADLHLALVTPNVTIFTADARGVLPQHISLKTMVAQTGAIARLVDALHRGDVREVGAAMESDYVIEPARRHLMPHLDAVRSIVHTTDGGCGLVISGAGPTLCAVCESEQAAAAVAGAMQRVYEDAGIAASVCHTCVDERGARVLDTG